MSTLPPPPKRFRIEALKVTAYLLNLAHPDGGSKAKFFLSYGFSASTPSDSALALLEHPLGSPLVDRVVNSYGVKFVYEGPILAPNGPTSVVRSVWEVKAGDRHARLVTAYPCAGRDNMSGS